MSDGPTEILELPYQLPDMASLNIEVTALPLADLAAAPSAEVVQPQVQLVGMPASASLLRHLFVPVHGWNSE